ncbi:F0F1 ATP synthase subunit B [Mycoplasma capricolum]|uniref:ATP synthase subunit b n=3 Tax=Mycoplasma capricolum subsp. capricolum TaxID=40479 RepID=ATPF_MYCCT|nr:F0F1 ATP synthase subunit B [Mycoplasma capricolum]Q2ST38.1 RecName: Full=ATP synthase subunit b; AltName: Full=ATP synthase F(0) sector subunit b; AltName: Full=ATPase subunit I; AltName: Full=F-type ATPase subunit b; Short=F-ATPase subunit b [Mycoplasma capricolum subsp. capricolum ATCC 27343]ABC01622.1 ATP synthase F0, B subunit [Mycoplasma capricolum subsp. capricolum ATCC 27343]KEZ20670.1 ATP synthase B chain [Mycoplasma capricolum subsp. capricolum 14232]KIM13699.1 F0F1 ATP synthase su
MLSVGFNIAINATTQGVPKIIESLFPNLPNFIAHLLATIVLVIVLAKLVYKPYKQMIEKQRQKITEVLSDAIEKQTQANIKIKQANSLLEEAKTESVSIINTARVDAEIQKNKIIDNANLQAKNIQSYAQNSIKQEKIKAQLEIKNTIVNLAINSAEKILSKEIDKNTNKKLIEEFIKDLD